MSFDFDRAELADVSRHFGRRRAVTRVTLTVRQCDILGLLGPNGAGKSTLIGMLATLVRSPYAIRPLTVARRSAGASGCWPTNCTSIRNFPPARTWISSRGSTVSIPGTLCRGLSKRPD